MSQEAEKNEEKEEEDVKIAEEVKMDDKKAGKVNKDVAERIQEELEDYEYYHGNLLEDEAKGLLPKKGDFMLRTKVNVDNTKEVLLTANLDEDKIVDVKLRLELSNERVFWYTFDQKIRKKKIKDLIGKHERGLAINPKGQGFSLMLFNGVAKQSWEFKKESIDLMKKLGEGAFGEVYSGKLKLRFGKAVNVAVKVIKRTGNNDKATTELQKEAALMRRFSHVNVVKMYGMVIERETIMVVMELISGGGLNDYVKKNKVSMEEKGVFALDIATGLGYIHSLGCIHRDIACRNCLIDITTKRAKVSDFGLTRQTDVYKIQPNERIPIRWCAPEVLKTLEYTRAADMYAYGILVWEIVSDGAIPFDTKSNAEIKEGIKSDEYRPKFPEGTPNEISEAAMWCWKTEPGSRPGAMKEVIERKLKRFQKVGSEADNTGEKSPVPLPPTEGKEGKKKTGESTKRREKKAKPKSKDKVMKSTRRT